MKCSEATLAGVAPGTVQPSRLRSSLRLFLSLTFSLLVSSSLLPLSPVQQKCLSLEGYTVSNPGQRPGIARGKERLAWRAVRPRRWRREPHLLALSPMQQKYLSQEGYTVSKSACHNGQSAALLSDSGLVMYFSTLPAPSSSAPYILTILTRLNPQATPGDSR